MQNISPDHVVELIEAALTLEPEFRGHIHTPG